MGLNLAQLDKLCLSKIRMYGQFFEGMNGKIKEPGLRTFGFTIKNGLLFIILTRIPPDGRHLTQIVRLESSPCNFGGERHWFICPGCESRCVVMYDAGQVWGDKDDNNNYGFITITDGFVESLYCRTCCRTGRARFPL